MGEIINITPRDRMKQSIKVYYMFNKGQSEFDFYEDERGVFFNEAEKIGFIFMDEMTDEQIKKEIDILIREGIYEPYLATHDSENIRSENRKRYSAGYFCYDNTYGLGGIYNVIEPPKVVRKPKPCIFKIFKFKQDKELVHSDKDTK